MHSAEETNRAIDRYGDMIRRICMIHLKNYADTEDIFQTVFLKYVLSSVVFESEEHEKAWLIRVTVNACRDLLKSFFRSRTIPLQEALAVEQDIPDDDREILEAVLTLPPKYKDVVYLYYYEEYSAKEISRILKKNVNTVYTLLSRARGLLQELDPSVTLEDVSGMTMREIQDLIDARSGDFSLTPQDTETSGSTNGSTESESSCESETWQEQHHSERNHHSRQNGHE